MKRNRFNKVITTVIGLILFSAMAADVSGFDINSSNYRPISNYPGIKTFDYSVTPVRESIDPDCMVDPEYAFRIYDTTIDEYFGNISTYTHKGIDYKGVLLKNNTKGKCGVRYNKLFRYQDDWIDVKTTYVDWKAKDTDKAFVHGGFCKVRWTNVSYVRLKHEFFKSGTNEPVEVKGFFTYNDVDNYQGIGLIPSELTKLWRNKNGSILQYQITEEGYLFIRDLTGDDLANVGSVNYDPVIAAKAKFSYQFEGTSNNQFILDGNADASFNIIQFQATKDIPSDIPDEESDMIKKEVTTSSGEHSEENSVRSWDASWQYRVAALIPMETEAGNLLDAFSITDQVDSCLQIEGVKILRGAGSDVTNQFDIQIDNNMITASSNCTGDKDAYGYMYYMIIDVKAAASDNTIRQHGHFIDDHIAEFKNKAVISYTDGKGKKDINTNETETKVVFPCEADVSITKRIRRDELYWDHGVPSFVIRLAGTEAPGDEEVEYNKVVTFTPEYVNGQGNSEFIEKTVTFKGVKEGAYTCNEYGTSRYKLDKVTDVKGGKAEGSGNGLHAVFNIDNEDIRKATFTNIRTGWGQYSDCQCIINKIGE